jgi:hypothetical protein
VHPSTGTGLFQYFIKVVPTTVKHPGALAQPLATNQYTVSEKFRPVAMGDFSNRAAFQVAAIL